MANNTKTKPSSSKQKSRSTRRPRSSNSKTEVAMGSLSNTKRDNDPNWYFTDAMVAEQASQLSFQQFAGSPAPVVGTFKMPTIMRFEMNACPMPSFSANIQKYDETIPAETNWGVQDASGFYEKDGLNLASMKLYTLMSTFTGRTSTYGPQDIGLMILAIGSIAELIEHIRRAFGLALTYNPRNRVFPRTLINALGFDADDLFWKLADYRMRFNSEIIRINQIPLLDNIGYLRKCRDIYQKIYLDEPSDMAQVYAMVPRTVWILNEDDPNTPSFLETKYITEYIEPLSMQTWLNELHDMITKVLESSTLNLVYADLINLNSKIGFPTWQFDLLAENYVVLPEFNATFLLQVHNLDVVGDPLASARAGLVNNIPFTDANDVKQDPNTNSIIYNPMFPNQYSGAHAMVVDMATDNPSLEDRIEALRYKVAWSGLYYIEGSGSTVGNWDVFKALPDHYCTRATVFCGDEDRITGNQMRITTNHFDITRTWAKYMWPKFTVFTDHPILYVQEDADPVIEDMAGDFTFYTTIDYLYMVRLNRIISQGLFEFRV